MPNVQEGQYTERYRPQFHFSPSANWMNDPNGMVYFEGEYHLFYQYHPYSAVWGPMHWGHAISKDLIRWEHLPIALYPDEHGSIFSGSAVVDWNDTTGFFDGGSGLVAIFTHADENPLNGRPRQRQSIAYSRDRGRTWVKYSGNPVLASEKLEDFRDPKVFWHEETHEWKMVLACGDHIGLYGSKNLKEWQELSTFGHQEGSHAGVWECPDLFPLVKEETDEVKWVLIVSIGDAPNEPLGSRVQYFIGSFDGQSFQPDDEKIRWLDYGRDHYAPVTWSDAPSGEKILIGWMSNWKYANEVPTSSWRGAMTLPRKLLLKEDATGEVYLKQTPIAEERTGPSIHSQSQDRVGVSSANAKGFLLKADLLLDGQNWVEFTLQNEAGERWSIRYDCVKSTFFINRTTNGNQPFHEGFHKENTVTQKIDSDSKWVIYVDQSSVEVFIDNGKVVFTELFFLEGEVTATLTPANSEAKWYQSIETNSLSSIWEKG